MLIFTLQKKNLFKFHVQLSSSFNLFAQARETKKKTFLFYLFKYLMDSNLSASKSKYFDDTHNIIKIYFLYENNIFIAEIFTCLAELIELCE